MTPGLLARLHFLKTIPHDPLLNTLNTDIIHTAPGQFGQHTDH